MTVQELIDELSKVDDKSKKVCIRTAENWGWETVSHIEMEDPSSNNEYIAIWRD